METDIRDRRDMLLTRRQVEALCRLSTSSIYRFMRDGLFPESIRVSKRVVRWDAPEIYAELGSRPRATGDRSVVYTTDHSLRALACLGLGTSGKLHLQALRAHGKQQ